MLNDEALKASWLAEVEEMRTRILAMRQELVKVLSTEMPERNFDYLLNQRGMFGYTGLSAAQVDRLREEFGVYIHRQRSHVCRRVRSGKCTTCGKGVCCGDVMQESRLELPSLQ